MQCSYLLVRVFLLCYCLVVSTGAVADSVVLIKLVFVTEDYMSAAVIDQILNIDWTNQSLSLDLCK